MGTYDKKVDAVPTAPVQDSTGFMPRQAGSCPECHDTFIDCMKDCEPTTRVACNVKCSNMVCADEFCRAECGHNCVPHATKIAPYVRKDIYTDDTCSACGDRYNDCVRHCAAPACMDQYKAEFSNDPACHTTCGNCEMCNTVATTFARIKRTDTADDDANMAFDEAAAPTETANYFNDDCIACSNKLMRCKQDCRAQGDDAEDCDAKCRCETSRDSTCHSKCGYNICS
ncbi:hypothetical protein BCR34DRAFT_599069 [Clohesyomyces aquaticus]|uniref:Uncharacterized protein n=1 Tax=Clohesyomyces aquaticus TaxID=1231657 RepID=A0A1Y1ZXL0_9PLEO|nr:hypothetical protein BCR34DRAFT_599069 [Clohesyomyces aquaticus]